MEVVVKFTFHLKSGKTFSCIEELKVEQFMKTLEVCKGSMREGVDAMVCFSSCCVRLIECAVVEWEVLSEKSD